MGNDEELRKAGTVILKNLGVMVAYTVICLVIDEVSSHSNAMYNEHKYTAILLFILALGVHGFMLLAVGIADLFTKQVQRGVARLLSLVVIYLIGAFSCTTFFD